MSVWLNAKVAMNASGIHLIATTTFVTFLTAAQAYRETAFMDKKFAQVKYIHMHSKYVYIYACMCVCVSVCLCVCVCVCVKVYDGLATGAKES